MPARAAWARWPWAGSASTASSTATRTAAHGPYRVDELLGPTAQREAALHRSRLARRKRARRDAQVIELQSLPWPDAARTARLVAGAGVMAATLAFLVR